MTIEIIEKSFDKSKDKFDIEIIIDGNQYLAEIANPRDEKVENELEWYFEEYIYEPFIAKSKTDKNKTAIYNYGKLLFESVFSDKEAINKYVNLIEENPKGIEDISVVIISDTSEFQSIHWETLFDPRFDKPLSILGAIFLRKSKKSISLHAKTNIYPYLNLLIVTARPREDEDVNYRTIQRPLIELLSKSGLRVKPHILRPGTYESLVRHLDEVGSGYYHIIHFDLHGAVISYKQLTLEKRKHNVDFNLFDFNLNNFQIRWGLYDLEPYDGKQAFLFFESDTKGVAIPVKADELAGFLQSKRIPVCILNACQSAKQDYNAHETSLAQKLSESGMQLVLAMSYSVSVSGAVVLMSKIYEEISKKGEIDKAIIFGRRELFNNKNRDASLGKSIELEDWILPVVYRNNEVNFNISDFEDEQEELNFNKRQKGLSLKSDFIGRDLDILKIEKLLLLNNHLHVAGIIGAGKTKLLNYLSRWWIKTNFIFDYFIFDFHKEVWDLEKVINKIARELFSEKDYKEFINKSFEVQCNYIEDILNEKRFLIIFESIDVAENNTKHNDKYLINQLFSFFKSIRLSFIIYSSRTTNHSQFTFKDNIYQLKGLNKNDTIELIKDIKPELFKSQSSSQLENIMKIFGGNPLALKLFFIQDIAKIKESNFLTKKRNSQVETIPSVIIQPFWDSLTKEEQKTIICLFPFKYAYNIHNIKFYFNEFHRNKEYNIGNINFNTILTDKLLKAGLLEIIEPKNKRLGSNYVHISIILSEFLEKAKNEIYTEIELKKIWLNYKDYYANLIAREFDEMLSSNRKEIMEVGIHFCDLEYQNYLNNLEDFLNTNDTIIYHHVAHYLQILNNTNELIRVTERIYHRLNNFSTKDIQNSIITLPYYLILERLALLYKDMNLLEKFREMLIKQKTLFEESIFLQEAQPHILNTINSNIALCNLMHGSNELAIEEIPQLLEGTKKDLDKKLNLASALRKQGKLNDAYELLREIKSEISGDGSDLEGDIAVNIGNVCTEKGEYKEAIYRYDEALKIFTNLHNKFKIGVTFKNMGACLNKANENYHAIISYKKAISIFIELGKNEELSETQILLAEASSKDNKYDESISYFKEALKYFKNSKNLEKQAYIYREMGNLYRHAPSEIVNEGIDYLNLSEELYLKTDNEKELIKLFTLRGSLYMSIDSFDKAISDFDAIISLADKFRDIEYKSIAYFRIANVYGKKGDVENSKTNYIKSIDIAKSIGFFDLCCDASSGIASLYMEKQEYDKSFEYYEMALNFSQKTDDKQFEADILYNLARLSVLSERYILVFDYAFKALKFYEHINDFNSIGYLNQFLAFAYYHTYKNIKDTFNLYLQSIDAFLKSNNLYAIKEDITNFLYLCKKDGTEIDENGLLNMIGEKMTFKQIQEFKKLL